jgi:predicted permease
METLRQDLRFALRAFAKNPAFSAIAILTLALGIGANTAIFSVINAVLLRTLPVPDPQQLVVLSDPEESGMFNGTTNGQRAIYSYHEFEGLRDQNQIFTGIFTTNSQISRVPVSFGVSAESAGPADISTVSGGYFPVLEVQPFMGRTFGTEVDQGLGAHPMAVISHAFWERRMQRDPAAIGRKVRIRQTVFDVIGVMPPDFSGIMVGESPDLWIPLTMQEAVYPGRDFLTWNPGSVTKIMFLQVVGRLKPGVSLQQAQASINVTFQQVLHAEAGTLTDPKQQRDLMDQKILARDARHGLSVLRGEYKRPLAALMGLVGLVLLLACANVANLLLSRATSRQRELAVRTAMGASRGRLLRQLLTESLLLAGFGGILGLLFSVWADRLLLRMVSTDPAPVPLDVHLDPRVLVFTVVVTLLTGILFGIAPALRATRLDLNQILRGASSAIRGGQRGAARLPMGKLLVGAQVAISVLLLVAAGLFVRSLQKLTSVELGYDAEHLQLFRMDPVLDGYKPAAVHQLYRELLSKFAAIPGVRGVTLSENGLFFGTESADQISILGYTPKAGQEMEARFDQIGPNYFSTIGIPVLMGRDVTLDDMGGQRHCWINQTMSRYYFAQESPIGRHLVDEYPDSRAECEVVGVVADAKYNGLRGETPRRFYVPFMNPIGETSRAVFEIRYAGAGTAVSAALRQAVHETDGTLDPLEIRTIPGLIDRRLVRDRLTARLSSFFGTVALLLACIGLYGVLSYNVGRRTSEIGVRMALGAQRGDILRLILSEALLVTLLGAAIGVGVAFAATRVLESLLYGVTARDPMTLAGAALALLVVAALAAAVPAWRASRVHPMAALRYE